MNEKWLPVIGFEGTYEVSNLGRVKSLARIVMKENQFGMCPNPVKEKILTPSSNGRYQTVCLSLSPGKARAYHVHILVLDAFVGPCPNGMLCRHFPDRSTNNNQLENLQWGTPEENQADKVKHGTSNRGLKHSASTRRLMSRKAKAVWKKRKLMENS